MKNPCEEKCTFHQINIQQWNIPGNIQILLNSFLLFKSKGKVCIVFVLGASKSTIYIGYTSVIFRTYWKIYMVFQ